mgnify:FL=1
MVTVKIRDDESLEQALRRFNREVLREGIIKEMRKREFYEKPSTVRKKEKQERSRRVEFLRAESK